MFALKQSNLLEIMLCKYAVHTILDKIKIRYKFQILDDQIVYSIL